MALSNRRRRAYEGKTQQNNQRRRLNLEALEARQLMAYDLASTSNYAATQTSATAYGNTYHGSMTPDGRYVVFETAAPNVIVNDPVGGDVFVKDTQTGAIIHVNTDAEGRQLSYPQTDSTISDDGRYVTFRTGSGTYIKHLQSNSLREAVPTVDYAGSPIKSGDSRFLAFESTTRNIVPGDNESFDSDIFLSNLQTGEIQLVSRDAAGNTANARYSRVMGLSRDGNRVLFSSDATNLIPGGTTAEQRFYWKDVPTGAIRSLGKAADFGSPFTGAKLSADGEFIVTVASEERSVSRIDFATGTQ